MINKINHPDCINTNTALCATIQVCHWLIFLTYLELDENEIWCGQSAVSPYHRIITQSAIVMCNLSRMAVPR